MGKTKISTNKQGSTLTLREQHIEWLIQSARSPQPILGDRVALAWQVAKSAAELLRQEYQVRRIRIFGSLVHPELFRWNSDVDLAVEGLAAERFWEALAQIMYLDPEITVDLVDLAHCSARIRQRVEREGVDV